MERDEIEAFVAIARLGAFTRAARALHLSQPAVSRRIELLEQTLGASLFERLRGGVVLTEAGHTFLPYAEAVLASLHDGVEAVRALAQEDRGTITLALVGTLASTILTDSLRRFRDAHPKVRLLLRTAKSDEVSALVRRGEATLGLRYFADPHPDLICHPIHAEAMVVVCSSRHRLATVRTLDPQVLAGEPWVTFPMRPDPSADSIGRALERQLAACGLGGAEIVVIDGLTAQKRLIEAGFGLGLLPESSVQEELRLGTLKALKIPAMRLTIPVTMVHRRRAYLSGAARRLMAVLVQSKGKSRVRPARHRP